MVVFKSVNGVFKLSIQHRFRSFRMFHLSDAARVTLERSRSAANTILFIRCVPVPKADCNACSVELTQ